MEIINRNKKFVRETIIVTVANFVVALLINLLAWRLKLVSGGLTGYSIYVNYLTNLPVGTVLLGLNLSLVVIALIAVGKGPGVRAIYGFATLSVFIDLARQLLNIKQLSTPPFAISLAMIVILSIVMGLAISVVLANNYSVGAYSTIYIIINNFVKIPAQNLFFTLDFILAVLTGITFGLDKGAILVVNALVAYAVVKVSLPKFQKYFSESD